MKSIKIAIVLQVDSPFKPKVTHPGDTSHFDKFHEEPLYIASEDKFAKELEMF